MGRALEWLPAVPSGNVVAVGGLQDTVLKSATLCSTPAAPALAPVEHQAEAIVQVRHKYPKGSNFEFQCVATVAMLVLHMGWPPAFTTGKVVNRARVRRPAVQSARNFWAAAIYIFLLRVSKGNVITWVLPFRWQWSLRSQGACLRWRRACSSSTAQTPSCRCPCPIQRGSGYWEPLGRSTWRRA